MATRGRLLEWLAKGVHELGTADSISVLIPLSSGTVEFYDAGTSNAKTVYSDVALSASLGSTVTLDSNGRKTVYLSGTYKAIVKDSDSNTIFTVDEASAQRNTFDEDITFNGSVTFASPFGFADGTAASPGIQFSSDTNTGIRRIGADNFALVANATDVVDIDASGAEFKQRVELKAGNSTNPGLVFATDTNTGLFLQAADKIGVSCGASEIARFSTGEVQFFQPVKAPAGSSSDTGLGFDDDDELGFIRSASQTMQTIANSTVVAEIDDNGYAFPTGIDPGDSGTYFKFKKLTLNNWDMDSTASFAVAHGLTFSKILSVTGVIQNDDETTKYIIGSGDQYNTTNELQIYITTIDSTNINLTRPTGGLTDSTDFNNASSFVRGYLLVVYEV